MRAQFALFLTLHFGIAMALASSMTSLEASTRTPRCEKWTRVPLEPSAWEQAYDGYGRISFGKQLELSPRAPASSKKTHASLVLLKDSPKSKDFAVRVRFENVKPLRGPAANPWEVFWLMFNYVPDGAHKKTNYFVFKPNGVELGTAWNEVDQAFLQTADEPRSQNGRVYEVTLYKSGQTVDAFVDGHPVLSHTATSPSTSSSSAVAKDLLFDHAGKIGLYTEDATVRIHEVSICDSARVAQGRIDQSSK